MSKKHHPQHKPTAHADARARIERTRAEGRYQQALELVKQLYKFEPRPENLELLKDTYLKRAQQLRGTGNVRDAATVVEVASRLDNRNRAWLEQLAQEMARCGDATRLQNLLAQISQLPGATEADGAASQQMLGAVADAAFMQEKNGRSALPAELQADHDRVVQAFREVEAGQDEAARQTLQGVGLRSPHLEWKILLRGLQAYYEGEDERARENWQRLDPARLPARLAAPFRAAIDPEYQKAQPAPMQARLRQQFEGTQGTNLGASLRSLRAALDKPQSLGNALQQAERLLPTLRASAPHLIPRLAGCFYWKILETGPNDLNRFRRIFGAVPEDPHLNRLNALGYEHGEPAEAHRYWQGFERDIAAMPGLWPGEQGVLARALVWMHMGENALTIPTAAQVKKMPKAFRRLEEVPKPLNPSAEKCFERAIELAPALLEAHTGLFRAMLQQEKPARAIEVGEALIRQFPDHAATMQTLGALLLHEKQFKRACEVFEQAVRLQPLDRTLREMLGQASYSLARELALAKEYEEARRRYRTGLDLSSNENRASCLIRWAVVERLAGEGARADDLMAQARALMGELYIRYHLLVEAHRMGLPGKAKTQHAKEFTAKLDDPVDPETALELLEYATALVKSDVTYTGQKTHLKKIIALAGKIDPLAIDENQLRRLIKALIDNEGVSRIVNRLFPLARARFPDSPHFPYLQAVYQMGDDPDEDLRDYAIRPHLEAAASLARKRPADEPGIKAMLADIERRLAILRVLNPYADMFSRMFGGPDDDDDDDDGGGIDPEDFFDRFFR